MPSNNGTKGQAARQRVSRAMPQPKAPVIPMPLTEGNAAWYRCKVERAAFMAALPQVERQYGWLKFEDEIPEAYREEIAGLIMDAETAAEQASEAEKSASEAEQTADDLASTLRFVLEDGNTELDYETRLIIEAALQQAHR